MIVEAEVKGVPDRFTSIDDLVEVLTVFIFTGSVQHAAANFGQYDEYAFPPNYPSFLRTERPKNKVREIGDLHNCNKEQPVSLKYLKMTLNA